MKFKLNATKQRSGFNFWSELHNFRAKSLENSYSGQFNRETWILQNFKDYNIWAGNFKTSSYQGSAFQSREAV